jgi:putative transposase
VYQDSDKRYGSPRIAKELKHQGVKISRPKAARLMKKAKIWSIVKKKFKVTTDSKHTYPVAENILNRQFNPVNISIAWVSDITYIKTK